MNNTELQNVNMNWFKRFYYVYVMSDGLVNETASYRISQNNDYLAVRNHFFQISRSGDKLYYLDSEGVPTLECQNSA